MSSAFFNTLSSAVFSSSCNAFSQLQVLVSLPLLHAYSCLPWRLVCIFVFLCQVFVYRLGNLSTSLSSYVRCLSTNWVIYLHLCLPKSHVCLQIGLSIYIFVFLSQMFVYKLGHLSTSLSSQVRCLSTNWVIYLGFSALSIALCPSSLVFGPVCETNKGLVAAVLIVSWSSQRCEHFVVDSCLQMTGFVIGTCCARFPFLDSGVGLMWMFVACRLASVCGGVLLEWRQFLSKWKILNAKATTTKTGRKNWILVTQGLNAGCL